MTMRQSPSSVAQAVTDGTAPRRPEFDDGSVLWVPRRMKQQ
jgi:hypothetical protein